VVEDGRDVTPARPKQRALLALLLLRRGEVVGTEELIEALWGSEPPETAAKALHGHVSALRKLLGAEAIETRPPGYALRLRPERSDLGRFDALVAEGRREADPDSRAELLRRALALFRGEPLSDFRYEGFARAETDRLEELRLGALEDCIEAELELGRHAELVAELERLVTANPLRERLRSELMLALYRSGRQADALHAYQEGRRLLADELALEPGPALKRLEHQILSHDPALAPPSRDHPAPRPREERKLVTILFCDLIGFTAQAEQLDPEDVRALQRPYFERVRTEIERFGGTVEKFIGDAVMAAFGAPVAHEDDAERAVRAALAIRDSLATEFELRIAVHSGEALVTLDAEPRAGEGIVTGDVVNTASRLQALAPTGGILVGEATYRVTRDAIEYREEEPVRAKGKTQPLAVWRAIAARAPARATAPRRLDTPLIGRGRELDQLTDAFERARAERETQLVTVVGVPGIGKSRILLELRDALGENAVWRQGRSLPYGDGVTFWALGEVVKEEAGILESDSAEAAVQKLERAATEVVTDPGEARWVARQLRPLLGLGAGGDGRDRVEGEAYAAWRLFVEGLAERAPLALALEDLHWADDGLLDFVDELVERAVDVPLLVVCTARPELLERRPVWGGGKRNAASVLLRPLSAEETTLLVEHLLEGDALPPGAKEQLVARAEGNPLYAEEYARLVAERESGAELSTPETLHGLIAARLDALSQTEKGLVQDAAVVGEVLWVDALAAIGEHPSAAVEELLRSLERKEFLRRRRESSVEGQSEYAFHHALVRDVAYSQIPRSVRGRKHRRAAEWIEALGRREDHAEMLAHHYLRALELARASREPTDALAGRAVIALSQAGDRAFQLRAYAVAAGFYGTALELAPEQDPGRPQLLLRYAKAVFYVGPDEDARASAERALVALAPAGDVEGAAEAELLLGELADDQGDAPGALPHFRRAASLVEALPTSRSKAEVFILNALRLTLADEEGASRYAEEGLAMAEELDSLDLRAAALDRLGVVRTAEGDVEDALRRQEQSVTLTEGFVSPGAVRATGNLASVLGDLGRLARSRRLHERCLELALRLGVARDVRWAKSEHVTDLYLAGEWEEALREANEYVAEVEATPHFMDGPCFGTRARIGFARGEVELADADWERSLSIARRHELGQLVFPALGLRALHLAEADPAKAAALADEVLGDIAGRRWIWAPAFLVELAHALERLGRSDDFLRATAAAYVTPWLESARAISGGDFVRAADVLAGIGSRPDEAYTRLRAAEALLVEGRRAEADKQLAPALEFFRSVRATRYLAHGERLVASSAELALGSSSPGQAGG
jgi:class 3 adenylate cyclase